MAFSAPPAFRTGAKDRFIDSKDSMSPCISICGYFHLGLLPFFDGDCCLSHYLSLQAY